MRWEAKLCVIVVVQCNFYIFTIGVTARGIKTDIEAASHIVQQKFKG